MAKPTTANRLADNEYDDPNVQRLFFGTEPEDEIDWIETFLSVPSETGKVIDFDLKPQQRLMITDRTGRDLTVKGRQTRASSLILARNLRRMVTNWGLQCLASGTEIRLRDGRIVPIENLRSGDLVYTHSGVQAPVSQVWFSGTKPTLKIGLAGEQISCTPDHRWWTTGGWCESRDLRDAWISVSARPYRNPNGLKCWALGRRKRGGYQIRKRSKSNFSRPIPLNQEFGWVVGLFLAEGTVTDSGLTFSLHESENGFADRLIRLFSHLGMTVTVAPDPRKRAIRVDVFDASLADLFREKLYRDGVKVIPDTIWETARAGFPRGVLEGFIDGDGTLAKTRPTITVGQQDRGRLLQLRDLAQSLFGVWGTVYTRSKPHGFSQRIQHMLVWDSWAGEELRRQYGWSEFRATQHPREWKRLEGNMVALKVKSITEGLVRETWDLEVAHPDHSFRTLVASLKNCLTMTQDDQTTSTFRGRIKHHLQDLTNSGFPYKIGLENKDELVIEDTGSRYLWGSGEERVAGRAYCVTPETRVLRADLRWVPSGDLRVGDDIIGFDEAARPGRFSRNYRKAKITYASRETLPVYELILEDGTVLRASADHKWLAHEASGSRSTKWVETQEIANTLRQGRRSEGKNWVPWYLPRYQYTWGEVRPSRLLERWESVFDVEQLTTLRSIGSIVVVDVRYLGEMECAALSSSTETYLAEGFGARNTGHLVHLSEFAHWPHDRAKSLIGGIQPSVPGPPYGQIDIESTPSGAEGQFFDMVQDSDLFNPASRWSTHFYPWWLEPRYRAGTIDGCDVRYNEARYETLLKTFSPTEEEEKLMQEAELDVGQILWRRVRKSEQDKTDAPFLQEYVETIDGCFLSKGGNYFATLDGINHLEQFRQMVASPKEVVERFPESTTGFGMAGLHVWQRPMLGRPYAVWVDCAGGGLDAGADYSAVVVMDCADMFIAARLAIKAAPQEVAPMAVAIAKHYNNALLGGERDAFGSVCVAKIQEIGYRNLWYYMEPGQAMSIKKMIQEPWGHPTQIRNHILSALRERVFAGTFHTKDAWGVQQMGAFTWQKVSQKRDGLKATGKGQKDDLVMCYAGLCYIAPQAGARYNAQQQISSSVPVKGDEEVVVGPHGVVIARRPINTHRKVWGS